MAHNGSKGVDGELGEAWTASNRRWGCRRPKLEDDDDAVVAGRPEWLLSVDRRRSSMRSSGTRREGSGVAVAASACGGALRCVRASQERARERRGEAQERGSEARGSWALLARPGRRGERAGRQLPWRACARRAATTRPVPLARGGGRLALASQLGWPAGPGQAAQCQAAGKLPFPISFSFLIF